MLDSACSQAREDSPPSIASGQPSLFVRGLATLACRIYATLPFVIGIVVAAFLAFLPHGVWGALVLTIVSTAALLPAKESTPDGTSRIAINGVLFFLAVAVPAAILPAGSLISVLGGAALEILLTFVFIAIAPRLDRVLGGRLQLELYPDALTSLFMIGLLAIPFRLARRRFNADLVRPAPPFRVCVIVASYNEDQTIARCLESIGRAAQRARQLPYVSCIQVVLADSGSTDQTLAEAIGRVDGVIDCPRGKLNARHHATVGSTCDVVIAADGDRIYPENWIESLVEPLASGKDVVAVTGETHSEGRLASGSAYVRRMLKIPFNGGNSSFFRGAYLARPYELSIDQFRHSTLWCQEEFLFPLLLAQLGEVVYVPSYSTELRPYPLLSLLRRHLFNFRLRTF